MSAWKLPPFNFCYPFPPWTFRKVTTKQDILEQITVMSKLSSTSGSLAFLHLLQVRRSWVWMMSWRIPSAYSFTLPLLLLYGYLWLEYIVRLIAHIHFLFPLLLPVTIVLWFIMKHFFPLCWPKYFVSLLVSLKTKCLFRPTTKAMLWSCGCS